MAVDVKDLVQKENNVTHLLRQVLDDELGPIRTEVSALKSNTDLSGEAKQTITRMEQDLQATERKYNDLQRQVEAMQVALNRPGASLNGKSPEESLAERKAAFNKALRTSYHRLSEEEKRVINYQDSVISSKVGHGQDVEYKTVFEADSSSGGILALPEYVTDLIQSIILVSPMSKFVDRRPTSKQFVRIFKRVQTSSASRIAEQATRTETQNPKFGAVQIFPYEAYALTLISNTELDDSAIDLGAWLMDDFSTQFAKLEGNEIINGLGAAAGQCMGFLNDPNVTASGNITTSANSGKVDYATMVKLMHSLKTGYRVPSQAAWVFTTETLGLIRQLTDTTGRPLWQPFGGADLPGQLWGYQYAEMPDMPQVATNNYAIAFGNFKVGYCEVVRMDVSIQTLRERYIDQNATGFLGWYRFGGDVKLAEAIKLYKIA